jgi:hypothetical protein
MCVSYELVYVVLGDETVGRQRRVGDSLPHPAECHSSSDGRNRCTAKQRCGFDADVWVPPLIALNSDITGGKFIKCHFQGKRKFCDTSSIKNKLLLHGLLSVSWANHTKSYFPFFFPPELGCIKFDYVSSKMVVRAIHISVVRTNFKPDRFQVLKAASMKMAVFWAVAPCSLVEVHGSLRGTYCFHHQGKELQ